MDKNTNTSPGNDPSQGDQTVTPPAQGATTPQSQGDQSDATVEVLKAKIAELERDNRKYRTERKQQDDAAAAAEQQRLKEQGEFRALAEKHEARVKELEPINERYSQLSSLVAQQIETQIKDWPAEVKTFDPGADAPIEQRLSWLEKSKPLIEKLAQQQRATNPGNGPNPRPIANTPDTARDKFLQDMRRSGKYGV
jgi:chromosome segregation ATPase